MPIGYSDGMQYESEAHAESSQYIDPQARPRITVTPHVEDLLDPLLPETPMNDQPTPQQNARDGSIYNNLKQQEQGMEQRLELYTPDDTQITPEPIQTSMKEPGNIDLNARPIVKNADGTISTVRTLQFNTDDGEILVPSVAHDGSRILSNDEAWQQFKDTGKHLGIFDNKDEATAYAEQLHKDQEKLYAKPMDEPFKDNTEKEAVLEHISQAHGDPFEIAALRQKRAVLSKDKPERTLPLATVATHMMQSMVKALAAPGKAWKEGLTSEEEISNAFNLATLMVMGPAPIKADGILGSSMITRKGSTESTALLEYDLALAKHEHNVASWKKHHGDEPLPEALASFKPEPPLKAIEAEWEGILEDMPTSSNFIKQPMVFKEIVEDLKTPQEIVDFQKQFADLLKSQPPKNSKMSPEEILDTGIRNIAQDIQAKRTYSDYLKYADHGPDPLLSRIEHTALSFIDRWNPNAREARATAQGFTQDAFHGASGTGFKELAVKAPREYGFYSTAHPELATLYADNRFSPAVLPLRINTRDYRVYDAKGRGWGEVNEAQISRAIEEGKKGVIIHNVWDEPSGKGALSEPKTVFITLDPTTVRSKFAKFGEESIGLNNLLASGAAIILGKSVVDEAKKSD